MKGSGATAGPTVLPGNTRALGQWQASDNDSDGCGEGIGSCVGFSEARNHTGVRKLPAMARLDSIGEDEVFESLPALPVDWSSTSGSARSTGMSRSCLSDTTTDTPVGTGVKASSERSSPAVAGECDGIYAVLSPSRFLMKATAPFAHPKTALAVAAAASDSARCFPAHEAVVDGCTGSATSFARHLCHGGYKALQSASLGTATVNPGIQLMAGGRYTCSVTESEALIPPATSADRGSYSNTSTLSTTLGSSSSGYGSASTKRSASGDSLEMTPGRKMSRELDMELVRLEILVDSLEEMEEQLAFNEQQEDALSEYQSSEDGDVTSAVEVG